MDGITNMTTLAERFEAVAASRNEFITHAAIASTNITASSAVSTWDTIKQHLQYSSEETPKHYVIAWTYTYVLHIAYVPGADSNEPTVVAIPRNPSVFCEA